MPLALVFPTLLQMLRFSHLTQTHLEPPHFRQQKATGTLLHLRVTPETRDPRHSTATATPESKLRLFPTCLQHRSYV
eukprot:4541857-Amphidinium_carterae.1